MDGQQNTAYQTPVAYEDSSPLSIGQYIGMMILTIIPIVGLVMTLIWAFGGSRNINKKNYARAALILVAISYVLCIVLTVSGIAALGSIAGSGMSY